MDARRRMILYFSVSLLITLGVVGVMVWVARNHPENLRYYSRFQHVDPDPPVYWNEAESAAESPGATANVSDILRNAPGGADQEARMNAMWAGAGK